MPKDIRLRPSLSCDQSRARPYPCNPKNADDQNKPINNSAEDIKHWDDIHCPICMEPPHNALLLRCSSFERGCRAYICDTSYRHSNCFDQLSKSVLSKARPGDVPPMSIVTIPEEITVGEGVNPAFLGRSSPEGEQSKLLCPLCRGEVYGFVKVKYMREYLNNKGRSCANETCDFSGTYSELRKHARTEHPNVQPTEVDPERQRNWERLENEEDSSDQLEIEIDPRTLFDCLFSVAYLSLEASVAALGEDNDRRSRELARFRRDYPSSTETRFHSRSGDRRSSNRLNWRGRFNNQPRRR